MAIPRRLIVLAASAAAGAALWYVAQRAKKAQDGADKGAVDDANREKDKAKDDADKQAADKPAESPPAASTTPPPAAKPAEEGARKELALFLAGDAWHDEIGWQALWEKDGVAAPDAWLRDAGRQVLAAERTKLTDHPALLAGCRRRWIVVCRYAGIDVGDAASLWNETEATAKAS